MVSSRLFLSSGFSPLLTFLTSKSKSEFDSSYDGPLSPPKRLETYLLASIFVLTFLHDILSAFRYPRQLRRFWIRFTSPFRDFLTLDDLLDPVDRTLTDRAVTGRYLAGLAAVEALGWIGRLIYAIILHHTDYATKSLVLSVSWVSR